MSIAIESKLNRLLLKGVPGGLFFSAALSRDGYSPQLVKRYRDSGWLDSLMSGVLYRMNDNLSALAAVYSYCEQVDSRVRIAAHSALDLKGFSHYVPMGKPRLMVAFPGSPYPKWTSSENFDMKIVPFSTDVFTSPLTIPYKDERMTLQISSPEQAFAECLHLVPKYYNYMDLYYVMEMLTAIDPHKVETVLANTSSQKVKRMYLYMAEKAGHYWFDMIDVLKIALTTSKLQLAKGGTYIPKYRMTIPKELRDYE